MSNHPPAQEPWTGLLARVVDQITPLFITNDTDPTTARLHAIGAIDAYAPQSVADVVNIARILAFSMATLAALGIAAAQDLTPAQKMRYFGRANALNRSADQTERTMTQRRRDQRGTATRQQPDTAATEPQAAANQDLVDDERAAALVEEAMAEFRATQASRPAPPVATPRPLRPEPPKSAIHVTQTLTAAGAKASYKDNLMQHSAIHRVAAMIMTPPPG